MIGKEMEKRRRSYWWKRDERKKVCVGRIRVRGRDSTWRED